MLDNTLVLSEESYTVGHSITYKIYQNPLNTFRVCKSRWITYEPHEAPISILIVPPSRFHYQLLKWMLKSEDW